jgi:hypothetical protein
MKKILSNAYGREIFRIFLLFLSMKIFVNFYKPLDNKFIDGCIQVFLLVCVVSLIKYIVKKPKSEI